MPRQKTAPAKGNEFYHSTGERNPPAGADYFLRLDAVVATGFADSDKKYLSTDLRNGPDFAVSYNATHP